MRKLLGILLMMTAAAGQAKELAVRGDFVVPTYYNNNGSIEVEVDDLYAGRDAVLKALQTVGGQLTSTNEQTRYGSGVDSIYMNVVVSTAATQSLFHEIRGLGNVVQSNLPAASQDQWERFIDQVDRLREELKNFKGGSPVIEKVALDKLREWEAALANNARNMGGITLSITISRTGTRAKQYGGRRILRDLSRLAIPAAMVLLLLGAVVGGGVWLGRALSGSKPKNPL